MFKKITRKQLGNFLKRYATERRILDIGAGNSNYKHFFPNRIMIDIDPDRKPDMVADAHALPFLDEEFEMVLCTEVIEHLEKPKQAISEMRRVLRPGGLAIVTTRFVFPLHDAPGDYWRFTKYGLRELFKEWDIVELVAEGRSFTTIAVLLQRICYQSDLRGGKMIKFLIFVLAQVINNLNWIIKKEYGDITRREKESEIMSSGLYLVARKRKNRA